MAVVSASAPAFAVDAAAGAAMHALLTRLFPIPRSLTGDGVRETLRILAEHVPIVVEEIPTGTTLFDWTVPPEWNVREAFVEDSRGRRVIDIRNHTLHLVGYSAPVRTTMTLAELQKHLHSIPEQPDLIPYRTSYYDRTWGFCLSHRERTRLVEDTYLVSIDSTLADGSLSYGECVLPGRTTDQVVVYSHVCHPSLANDNLSGIVVCAFLARWLATEERRYTYRFVFGPGTLGSLAWLDRNRRDLSRVKHGLVAVLLGHGTTLRYKRTRHGAREIDRVAAYVLRHSAPAGEIDAFSPFGYDERQFGSPGFDLPIGRLSRSTEAGYSAYHTSGDDLELVTPEALAGSLAAAQQIVSTLEHNRWYLSTSPFGEPQLGRRGLYRVTGGPPVPAREAAMLWTLNLSDGAHSLVDIADRAGLPFRAIHQVATELERAGLLQACEPAEPAAPGAAR